MKKIYFNFRTIHKSRVFFNNKIKEKIKLRCVFLTKFFLKLFLFFKFHYILNVFFSFAFILMFIGLQFFIWWKKIYVTSLAVQSNWYLWIQEYLLFIYIFFSKHIIFTGVHACARTHTHKLANPVGLTFTCISLLWPNTNLNL